MSTWFFILAQFSALAPAVFASVFLAFSDFLMRALSRINGVCGVASIPVVSLEVFRHIFIPLFLAMTPVSIFIER